MNTRPPATQPLTGRVIPRADWAKYGPYGSATEILADVTALVEALPGVNIIVAPKIVETSGADGYVLTTPVTSPVPAPTDVGDWSVQCNFSVGMGTATAADYVIDDWALVLIGRELVPDMAEGDTNYQEVGHGANTIDAPVPSKLALTLLPQGLAELHWVPA